MASVSFYLLRHYNVRVHEHWSIEVTPELRALHPHVFDFETGLPIPGDDWDAFVRDNGGALVLKELTSLDGEDDDRSYDAGVNDREMLARWRYAVRTGVNERRSFNDWLADRLKESARAEQPAEKSAAMPESPQAPQGVGSVVVECDGTERDGTAWVRAAQDRWLSSRGERQSDFWIEQLLAAGRAEIKSEGVTL